MELAVGLSGKDLVTLARALVSSGLIHSGEPSSLTVDDKPKPVTHDWIERWAPACRREVMADWKGAPVGEFLSLERDEIVKAETQVDRIDPQKVLSALATLPFELCSFLTIHLAAWRAEPTRYFAPGFASMHWSHGWACAFKGAGHNRLVSRRWLDHGPWLVRRGPNDTTLVQFHDLEADAATALEQAKPGHERMGISETGGFLQWPGYVMTHEIGGLYVPAERALRVVVHARDVSESEMTDAAALRAFQGLGADQPIDKIAYVFMDEAAARKHLHELWLRGIEVRAMIRGTEVRLDAEYAPAPNKPEWVRRIEEQEAAGR